MINEELLSTVPRRGDWFVVKTAGINVRFLHHLLHNHLGRITLPRRHNVTTQVRQSLLQTVQELQPSPTAAITSKIKRAIKHKTSPARLEQLLQPSLAFCVSLQPMTAYRPVLQDLFCVSLHVIFYL